MNLITTIFFLSNMNIVSEKPPKNYYVLSRSMLNVHIYRKANNSLI